MKQVSNESKMQNWYVVQRIKPVFSWEFGKEFFFTKLARRIKQRNSPLKKENLPFKTQVISFLNLKHIIDSGGVPLMLNLVLYVFKGKQPK